MSDNTYSNQLINDSSKFTLRQDKLSTSTLLLPVSIASTIMLFLVMDLGVGVSTDSIVFLSAAENILNHGQIYVTAYGVNEPMTHFPPLYPLILAGLSFIFRCSIETSAKLTGALTFGMNIYLVGIILRKTGVSLKNAIFAILLLAFSEYMIIIHAKMFTEPLFITFMLLSFIFLEKYLRNSQILTLIFASLSVSFACLTRYAGLPLIPLAIFALLFFANTAWRSRIKSIIIFSIVTLTPLSFWFIRNISLSGTSTNRGISFHPLGVAHIRQLVRSFLFVFLPNSVLENLKSIPGKVIVIILIILLITSITLAILAYRKLKTYLFKEARQIFMDINPMNQESSHKQRDMNRKQIITTQCKHQGYRRSTTIGSAIKPTGGIKILLLFLIVYPAFLLCSISLADYTTPLSYRIMLPEFIIALPIIDCGII